MTKEDTRVVVRDDSAETGWLLFREPERVLLASRPDEVMSVLSAAEAAAGSGAYAAGFISYEAAPGLDKAFRTKTPAGLPPAWFGVFRRAEPLDPAALKPGGACDVGDWAPSLSAGQYRRAIARIKEYLEQGETYQVNFTIRLRTRVAGAPWDLFRRLQWSQRGSHCAYVECGDFAICSASPELFFSLDGDSLVSRPMKGTAGRGLTCEEDVRLADALQSSAKNRAENVMIVDMVRNDMGRVALAGSVRATRLFDVERYPTVLQMTSTVDSKVSAPFAGIVRALFPCASITGAPKVRTMRIIEELEPDTRGVYTGCIGYLAPDRKARFNVAIRTVCVDRRSGAAEYGVGGGIVWDSDPDGEYEECLVKARVLMEERPEFELLETVLWEPEPGYFLLDRHIERITRSAVYFGFKADEAGIRRELEVLSRSLGRQPEKIRLLVGERGDVRIEHEPLARAEQPGAWRVALAADPVKRDDPFLYHKTTHRAVYEQARKSRNDVDDVLLWNEDGELTESTIANVVVRRGGRLITPPVRCGILPGVFRQWLLERGEIEEGVIPARDLPEAEEIFLVNSVRKWVPAVLAR